MKKTFFAGIFCFAILFAVITAYCYDGINSNQPISVGSEIYSEEGYGFSNGKQVKTSIKYYYQGIDKQSLKIQLVLYNSNSGENRTDISLPVDKLNQAYLQINPPNNILHKTRLLLTVIDEFANIKVEKNEPFLEPYTSLGDIRQ